MNYLRTKLGRLELINPLIPASGTFFSLDRVPENFPLHKLGAFLSKTITLEAREGNDHPRIKECDSGMMNSIGLENKGWKYFENTILPLFQNLTTQKWVSIAGSSPEEFAVLAEKLDKYPIDALEINVSCPNVHHGGVQFCQHADSLRKAIRCVRDASKLFLIAKISIETHALKEALSIINDEGADAVCIGNTIRGMSINITEGKAYFKKVFAGYSGPAIKPIALRAVWEARQWMPDYPIIGCGGIGSYTDALEFIMAGANAIEIGTANFIDPLCIAKMEEQLQEYCKAKDTPLQNFISKAHRED
jgi:dihydroorotate dehydrogenase (NAD+) catalytic subunit